MKKLLSAIFLCALFTGCATTQNVNTSGDVCSEAPNYVAGVQNYMDNVTPKLEKVTLKLEHCREMEHGTAYFIYSGVQALEGIPDATELHVMVVLEKKNGKWVIMGEKPFATAIDPKAEFLLRHRSKNSPYNL